MFNLYKMHMYRASRATSTLVLGILFAVFLFINSALASFVFGNALELMLGGGISATTNFTNEYVYAAEIHNFFINTSDAFNILITIFTVIFVHSDYSKGFIKNTYNLFEEKWKFVVAKWTSLMTWVSGVFWAYSFLSIAISAIILDKFRFEQIGDYLRVAMVTWLGLVAFLTIVFLITSLFKSAAGGMVIGIIIASGLLQTIEKLLDLLIAKLAGANLQDMVMNAVGVGEKSYFKISDYCLDSVYLSYSAEMGAGDTVRTILVFLAYIALGLGLVILFVRKRDVR
ncbi:MAG: hypothetical protein J5752_09950 [Clostridiales bacterium]|nr:hypothetical protein [Clostridiales bacterium]